MFMKMLHEQQMEKWMNSLNQMAQLGDASWSYHNKEQQCHAVLSEGPGAGGWSM